MIIIEIMELEVETQISKKRGFHHNRSLGESVLDHWQGWLMTSSTKPPLLSESQGMPLASLANENGNFHMK